MVTLYTTKFKIQKLLRSTHKVYLCVLRESQNKQRLFHCTALLIGFILEMECVYCAVRTGSLNAIQANISLLGRTMDQAASLRSVTTEAVVRSRVDSCEICSGKMALRQRMFQFSPVSNIPPKLRTPRYLHVSLTRRTNGQMAHT